MTVNRDLTGLALQQHLEDWTGLPCGYVHGPPSSEGDSPAYPYLTIFPHAGEQGIETQSRAFGLPGSGADLRFDIQATGTTDLQAALALDRAVTELTARTGSTYDNEWTGSTPAPCERSIVAFGPPGKDPASGVRWTSIEIRLAVLD